MKLVLKLQKCLQLCSTNKNWQGFLISFVFFLFAEILLLICRCVPAPWNRPFMTRDATDPIVSATRIQIQPVCVTMVPYIVWLVEHQRKFLLHFALNYFFFNFSVFFA